MLRNRVTPRGDIIQTAARGKFMGNRGVIHNEAKEIIAPFKHKAWITCALEFKNRHRKVMTPGRWTELFFLDEATAFAAGHRPCGECRRSDFVRFKAAWIAGNPEFKYNPQTSIKLIDAVLHAERIDGQKKKVTFDDQVSALPDGTFIELENVPFLLFENRVWKWSPFGYEGGARISQSLTVRVLTPRSIVNTFRTGYKPGFDTSGPATV